MLADLGAFGYVPAAFIAAGFTVMLIGAHQSIAGGLHLAFDRALSIGAEALQIFTKSGRQWAARTITEEDARQFRAAHARTGLPVIAHNSYLINLGAEAGEMRTKSINAFRDELVRCEQLGVPWLVAHPGSNEDPQTGLRLIAEGLSELLRETAGYAVGVLLEITAGQGNSLGYRFEHLAELLDRVDLPERIGICLDSCHLYAAGYDIATDEGYARTMDDLERLVGSSRVRAMHLNDAKKGLACRVDRHEHIGEGTLGEQTFVRLVRDTRFGDIPAVLETPEGQWREEIALLRGLRDAGVTHRCDPHLRKIEGLPSASKAGGIAIERLNTVSETTPTKRARTPRSHASG